MNTPQTLDEPISVEAQLSGERLRPQQITWRGQTYTVIYIGRQWAEESSTCVLVELHDGSRMEIRLLPNLRWRLRRYWPPIFAA